MLWKNRQYVANRRRYVRRHGTAVSRRVAPRDGSGRTDAGRAHRARPNPASTRPAFARFCATFPDAFFVSERARVYLDPKKDEGEWRAAAERRLSQHDGLLPRRRPALRADPRRAGQRELDRLWQEFDFITGAPMRQYASFLWFERAESRFMRGPRVRLRPRRGQGRGVARPRSSGWPRSTWRRPRASGASDVAL